jgi:hypothetical protein
MLHAYVYVFKIRKVVRNGRITSVALALHMLASSILDLVFFELYMLESDFDRLLFPEGKVAEA